MIPVVSTSGAEQNSSVVCDIAPSSEPKFLTEKELVRRAIKQSDWNLASAYQDLGAVTELETPNGIVDIAYYRFRKDWRGHAVVGEIPSRWAYAFRLIPYRRAFSTSDFAVTTAASDRRAREAILEFSRLGLCRPTKNGEKWIKIRQPSMALQQLISVEAKLRDWRKALSQAVRYLAYSDQSWVLLDARSVRSASRNIHEFEVRNVGLASISMSGRVERHFVPDISAAITQHDRWVVNSELLKRINYR